MRHEPQGWSFALGPAEVVVSAVVLVAFARHVCTTRQASHAASHDSAGHAHGVDWVDAHRARLVRRDGKAREIDLKDLRNAADVRAALEDVRLRIPAESNDGATDAAATAAPQP